MKLLDTDSCVVAVEKSPSARSQIMTNFSTLFARDKYAIVSEKYERAIELEPFIDYFARRRRGEIGFDIMELDFTDSIFSMNENGESRILDALIRTLMLQLVFGRKRTYYLIASFRMRLRIPRTLREQFSDPVRMLCEKFICRYDQELSDKLIELSNGDRSDSRVDWSMLYSIPLVIIEHAPRLIQLSLRDIPYTHVSQSVGAKARIVSFVFTCEYSRPSFSRSIGPTSQKIQDAFGKVHQTVWVKSRPKKGA